MGNLFGGGATPPPMQTPPPADPENSPEAIAEAEKERRRQAQAAGRASTIVAGGLGDTYLPELVGEPDEFCTELRGFMVQYGLSVSEISEICFGTTQRSDEREVPKNIGRTRMYLAAKMSPNTATRHLIREKIAEYAGRFEMNQMRLNAEPLTKATEFLEMRTVEGGMMEVHLRRKLPMTLALMIAERIEDWDERQKANEQSYD